MNLIRGFSIQCALALLALSLAAAAGCGRRAEAGASAGESHPKVTVAQPLAATVATSASTPAARKRLRQWKSAPARPGIWCARRSAKEIW